MKPALYLSVAATLIIGTAMGTPSHAEPYSDPYGCNVIALAKADYVAASDAKYKMSYFQTSEDKRESANGAIDVPGQITGSFGLDKGRFSSAVNSSVDISEQRYLALRWLPPNQVQAWLECIKAKTSGKGLTLDVKSWDNDNVVLYGVFQPAFGQSTEIKNFRQLIELTGVDDEGKMKLRFPNQITNQQVINVTVKRAKGMPFGLYVSTPDPVNINLPILPTEDCVLVDQSNGKCRQVIKKFNFSGAAGTSTVFPLPILEANQVATLNLVGSFGWSPTMNGPSGTGGMNWRVGNPNADLPNRPLSLPTLPVDGGSVPLYGAIFIGAQGALSPTVVEMSITICHHNPPQAFSPTCSANGLAIFSLN